MAELKPLRVLVACEESQAVCKAFRSLGHKAFSCDLQECSGGHPEWHIKGDCLKVLNLPIWDLVIAHPPCTYLTVAANRYYNEEKYGEKAKRRKGEREQAIKFFMEFANCKCKRVAIENPIGVISSRWKKPTQIIQPYQFGHKERKATCLWLKDLPPLKPTNIVEPDIIKHKSGKTDSRLHFETLSLPSEERAKIRSKTFEGIAKAMAEQWSEYILKEDK
jgi:site-specific DNA-cytosine methylase